MVNTLKWRISKMKKKKNLIIFGLIVIIIGGWMVLYNNYFHNVDSNRYLSSINEDRNIGYNGTHKSDKNSESFDFKKFDGKWSLMQFTSNKGNKISINDDTKISEGKFYIVILNSKYNIIAKKNELKDKGNINFTTPNDGKYSIRIIGANASGNFAISVSASNNIDISHKDFFD